MNKEKFVLEQFVKLGIHIKKLREERNITIKEMSERTKIRMEYLQKIEKGKAYGVSIDRHLILIANVLNIKMYELMNFNN